MQLASFRESSSCLGAAARPVQSACLPSLHLEAFLAAACPPVRLPAPAVQVTAATFGLEGWALGLPTFVVDPVVTEFLQGSTLLFGAALSLVLTRKLGARPWAQLAPQCLLIVLFTAELWALILPN